MVQVEVFTTLGQSMADAAVIAQRQVNGWLEKHPDLTLADVSIQTQVIREAPDINWCIITLAYRLSGNEEISPPVDWASA